MRFKYNSPSYKLWRAKCFKRDRFTCRLCGHKGGALNAHHIKRKVDFPHLVYRADNSITLCKKCHDIVTGNEVLFEKFFMKIVKDTLTIDYVYQFFASVITGYPKIVKALKDKGMWQLIPQNLVNQVKNM